MKNLKKFSALILSLLLILTAVFIPATITASAATEKDPTQSLLYGVVPTRSLYASASGAIIETNNDDAISKYGISSHACLTDGNTTAHRDFYKATDNQFVFALKERSLIDTVCVWLYTSAGRKTSFDVYVSLNSDDLFTEANKVYSFTATEESAAYQECSFTAKEGTLVGLYITNASSYSGDTNARICEVAAYGSVATTETTAAYFENNYALPYYKASRHNDSIIAGAVPYAFSSSDGKTVSANSTHKAEHLTNGDGTFVDTKCDFSGAARGEWNYVTYKLDSLYAVDGFAFYTAHLTRYMEWAVYVGNDIDTLYSGTPLYTAVSWEDTSGQTIKTNYNFGTEVLLGNAVKGRYVGFAVRNVNTETDANDTSCRVSEIQVFGEKTSGVAEKWLTSSSTEITDSYLGTSVIADRAPLFLNIDNNSADSDWDWNSTSRSAYSKNITLLSDGTLTGNHADVSHGKNAKIVWSLDKTTDVTGFTLFNHKTSRYEASYEVYASENLADLFDADNMIYEYSVYDADGNLRTDRNVVGGSYVDFYGDNIKKANYVAVWFREGRYTDSSDTLIDTGLRISEIAFFGTAGADVDDVYSIPYLQIINQTTDTISFDKIAAALNSDFTYENSLLKSDKLTINAADGTINTPSSSGNLTDGVVSGLDGNTEYRGDVDERLVYYLGAPTKVTGFAHIKSNYQSTSAFKIYVGYSADTLFSEENLAFDMSNPAVGTHLMATAVEFVTPKDGLYFGVEYCGVWGSSSNASYSAVTRIGEISAWGTQEDLGYELTPSIPATSNADTAASSSDYSNLLKGLVAETGYRGSVHANGTNWLNGITDGVANLHYDMNYTAESSAAASELFYDLGYTATAYEFAYWMTCAERQFSYQVYMSDSLDTLYKEPVLVWDYKISPDSVGQKFVLDEPMQVRYVAIRMGDTRAANDSFRTSEIALFGTRDNKAIEGESFATIERVDVETSDEPTYITYTNTFNFPAGQLSGVAKIEEIGTLVYPTTALGDTPLTLDFDGAAKAKSDEKAIAEITEYDEAGYTAVKAQSTFRGLANVGDTTKLTAVSYVTVSYGDDTVTYYSNPMVYSKTQMKRLAAKEQINTYGLLATDNIIAPVEGKAAWNCAISEVWSYAMQAKNLLKTNKTEPIKNAGAWLTDVKTQYGIEQEWLDNGLVTMGDTSRISAVIRKLMKGESVTVVGLGGSITEGYFSGDGSEQSRRVADFLAASFGEDKVTYVNAGIAATGAVMGAYRLNADVLSHNPDLVIIEYAVNDDRGDETAMAAYENIVRTLLSKDVAVLALHNVIYADNEISAAGSANNHKNIGKLYSLPQVSAFDAFYGTEIYAKGNDTTLYYYGTADRPNDGTHPNEKGHAASGALMANLIYTVMCNLEKLPTESAAIPTYPSQPQGNFIDADKAVIVKAQEVNDDGDARVAIEGAAYTESTLAVGKDTTRTNNTYNGYYTVAAGTTATLTLTNVSDAFLVVLENANGDKDAQVVTKDADGNVILENTLDAYYNGALSVDAARIINSDERVYHGETATVTVEVTATDAPVYIGGVMGCFN